MLKKWTNGQKALLAAGIVIALLVIFNWNSVWEWLTSIGKSPSEEAGRLSEPEVQPAPQQVVQNIIVTPRPVQPTCAQIKQQIDHFTNLLAQYPNSVQIKARLDQLKKQYADAGCLGGPKPNPNAVI